MPPTARSIVRMSGRARPASLRRTSALRHRAVGGARDECLNALGNRRIWSKKVGQPIDDVVKVLVMWRCLRWALDDEANVRAIHLNTQGVDIFRNQAQRSLGRLGNDVVLPHGGMGRVIGRWKYH